MFKLIVALSIVVNTNGVLQVTPSGQLVNETRFETEKSCMEYINTDAGKSSRLSIDEMIVNFKKKGNGILTVTYSCVRDLVLKDTI